MIIKCPPTLISGDVLREAAATDYRDILSIVRIALAEKLKAANAKGEDDCGLYVDVIALSSDRVIIAQAGRYYQYAYALSDTNQVILAEPVEVTRDFSPVNPVPSPTTAPTPLEAMSSPFMEAKNPEGTLWEIRVIDAGISLNNVNYPVNVLREAVPLFANARVFAKPDVEHIAGQGKDIHKLIGRLIRPRFVEAANGVAAGINADFELLAAAGDIPAKLLEAYQRGMGNIFGFSIDADGQSSKKGAFREAIKILKVNSVDLIIEPGAGGKVIRLIESVNPNKERDTMLRERMIEAVKAANKGQLPAGLDVDDDAQLVAAYAQATAAQNNNELAERLRLVEARTAAQISISASTLPAPAKERLLADFANRLHFTEADVSAAISVEREYLAKFTESGKVTTGDFNNGRITEERSTRVAGMLDDFFAGKRGTHSFKECYVDITGDKRVTGQLQNCDIARLREALGVAEFREAITTSGFADVLGNAMNRRMIAEYNTADYFGVWRYLTGNPVPLNDFRTQERVRYGGYGDLPTVAENGNYAALTSPGDEKATYAAAKKGGTETVTLESIKNDDVALIRGLPVKMGRAAKRTLGKFVLDFLRTNPAIYDAKALFHVDHANLGSAALTAASFAAARLAMAKQTEKDSGERLGINPKFLWVSSDLEEVAADLFRRNTNNDATFIQSLSPTIIPVWYWTDANDWCVSADPMDIPSFELGFMDGNEEPELFVQDMPNVGSLFSNDAVTYKIRHVYGGAITDYRGLYKAVVA